MLAAADHTAVVIDLAGHAVRTLKGHVELSIGGHGWTCFSLDGKYAWSHAPEVFDVKTKKLVATFKDEKGQPVAGSKYFEVHFRDGKVVQVGHEFGLGRK